MNDGTLFSIPVTGAPPTTIFSLSAASGEDPWGGLTLNGSILYGMTEYGGAFGDGTVFALNVTPTPEPSTFALFAASAVGLVGYAWRRRAAKRTANPPFDQHDVPAILSFPSHPSRAHAARRAA